ncbi:MAG: beta-galactosidase [Treponema sp.]|nr:beta-galactosidase [Treponema sp.]
MKSRKTAAPFAAARTAARLTAAHPAAAFTAALFTAALLCSCATSFSSGSPRRIPADHLGMAHGGFTRSAREYALLDELGSVWIRRTFDWEDIEPEEGRWDFAGWDAYVDSAKAAGKKILATLAYDVGWIYGEQEARRNIIPEKIPHYLRYVETVVRRYRDRIDAFEIWNEPNNPFYFWKGSDRDFFELARAAAAKIKEIDPAIKVAAAGFWLAPRGFIRGMFESGAMEDVDILSFHPYAGSPRGALRSYDRLLRIIEPYHFKGQIWITEIGFPTGGIYIGNISEDNYPEYIVKTLAGFAARGVEVNFWYELFDKKNRDEAKSRINPSQYFGLAYPDFTRKRGAAAFALCGRLIPGSEYRPDLPRRTGLPAAVSALYFRGAETDALILWNDGRPRRVRVLGPAGREYDIVSGEGRDIPGELMLDLDREPRILSWPRTEHPAVELRGD